MTVDPATQFAVKPELTGPDVRLRPFVESDLAALGPILAEPEVLRLTGSVHSSAAAAAESPVLDERTQAWYRTRAEQTDRLDLAVVDRAGDECVGEVVLNEWQPENQSCNFRILIGAAGRDRHLGSQATALVLQWAFTHTDLHRIELEVYAFNPRAQRMYERTGFTVEGRRRDAFVFDEERIDAIVMAILRPDWLARGETVSPAR